MCLTSVPQAPGSYPVRGSIISAEMFTGFLQYHQKDEHVVLIKRPADFHRISLPIHYLFQSYSISFDSIKPQQLI
jgi:hypothetical protein